MTLWIDRVSGTGKREVIDTFYAIRNEDGAYLLSTGEWLITRWPRKNGDVARFDEHGANLFIVGYEQARLDVARSIGATLS